jgi:hypothetical protein
MLRSRSSARILVGAILTAAVLNAPVRAAEPNKYLPDGTVVVVTFNFKQLLEAPLLKGDEKAFKQGMGEVGKMLEGFGVDPAKDVSRLVLAAGEQMQPKNILMLVEGRFDPTKVQNKLTEMAKDPKNNLEVTKEGTATIFQVKIPQQALPNAAVPSTILLTALDNEYLAVAVDRDALKEALAKKAGSRKAEVKKDVIELVGKISPKETASLVVVPPPELLAGSPGAGLMNVTGGVTVTDSVKTEILLTAKDADSAKALAKIIEETLDQVKQLLPLIAGQQPGFGPKEQAMVKEMMDSIKTTATNNTVTVKFNVSKEFIEKNSKKD